MSAMPIGHLRAALFASVFVFSVASCAQEQTYDSDGSTDAAAIDDTTISFQTADGVAVYGEKYFAALDDDAPLILLFHQGGSNGRGEYGPIAPWLNENGFRAIAFDQRSGGDLYGAENRTAAGLAEGVATGFCDAMPDLEAALSHVMDEGYADKVILWGSSYSGSLAFKLAADNPDRVAALIAFSPASGGPMVDCRARMWVDDVAAPIFVIRPAAEMERPTSVEQRTVLVEAGVDFLVVANSEKDNIHGSSVLVDERSGSDMSAARQTVITWLQEQS